MNATHMNLAPAGRVTFPLMNLAASLELPSAEVVAFFRDGRHGQPLLERVLAERMSRIGWTRRAREGGGGLLVDPHGGCWELRAVTDELSFAPSKMKGTGRSFSAEAFVAHVGLHAGVLAVDVHAFPSCSYWQIPRWRVLAWFTDGALGRSASIKRRDARALLGGLA
jgi:hypothetical protein